MARVLIVEDTEGVMTALRTSLTRLGHTVVEARDGEEGLARLTEGGVDVAVVDVWMPKLNGIDLLKKAMATGVDTRFIVMSGGGPDIPIEFTQATASSHGAITFLVKPFGLDRLREAVEEALAASNDGADDHA